MQDNAFLEDVGIKIYGQSQLPPLRSLGSRSSATRYLERKQSGPVTRRLCLHDETAWSVSSAAINRSCKAKHDKNAADYLGYSGSWTGGPAQRLNAGQAEEVPLRGDLII